MISALVRPRTYTWLLVPSSYASSLLSSERTSLILMEDRHGIAPPHDDPTGWPMPSLRVATSLELALPVPLEGDDGGATATGVGGGVRADRVCPGQRWG